jgi:hypothetical protein
VASVEPCKDCKVLPIYNPRLRVGCVLQMGPQSKTNGDKGTGYWANHSTVSLSRPLVEAIKVLGEPGERVEDTVRRLVDRVVSGQKESA